MKNKNLKVTSIVLGIMAVLYVLLEACYCYNNIQTARTMDFNNYAISEPAIITIVHVFGFAWCLLLIAWFIIASKEKNSKAFGVMAVIALSIYLLVKVGNLINQQHLDLNDTKAITIYYSIVGALNGIGNLLLAIAFIIMGRHLPEKARKWSVAIGICILVILVLRILHPMINSYLNRQSTPMEHVRTTYLMNASTNILTIVKFVFMAVFFFLCGKRIQQNSTEEGLDTIQ